MRRTSLIAAILALPLLAAPARADEVADAIAEAQRAYEAGQLQAAQTALQEALQLLSQKAAAGLAGALPAALPGWTADEPSSNAVGLGGLFGGASASRTYRNARGQTVEMQVMTDNPIIAQLGPILSNPMLAGAMGRLVRIREQRAIQGSDGNIQMLVDNRILVLVQGDASPDDKIAYARAIEVARLTGL